MKKYFKFFNVILAFILISCKSKVDSSSYLQNIENLAVQTSIKTSNPNIQVGDELMIYITAKDMDVVKPFNQNYSSSIRNQYSSPSNNAVSPNQVESHGPTYLVDSEGDINFPVLGKISTTGKNIEEIRDELKNKLSRYIINPLVTIRHTNYKITILGEVNKAGHYVIPEGQTTILNALGLAGDLTIYGKRDNVLVVRNMNGEITKGRINLTDSDFINSPFYNLQQNDVIVVSPNESKQKQSRLDPNATVYISVASVVIGLLALIFK